MTNSWALNMQYKEMLSKITTLFSIFKMAQGEEQQKPLNRDVGGRGGSDVSLSLQLCFINCLLYFYKHLVLEQSA